MFRIILPRLLLAAVFCLCLASVVQADTITFSTSGSFGCGSGVPCSSTGTSVTFGTGANTLTLSFVGASFSAPLNPGATQYAMPFGVLTATATGSGFTFPAIVNLVALNNAPRFFLGISQSEPFGSGPLITMVLIGGMSETDNTLKLDFLAPGNFGTAGAYVIDGINRPIVYAVFPNAGHSILVNRGETVIQGGVSAIPEPATIFLLSTGLLGLATRFRKRR